MKTPENITLLLLPGLDGSGILFEPLQAALPSELDSIIITYSSKPLSLQELAKFIYEKVPQNKPVVILAESFSGPVAMELLKLACKNVIGVIFCATFASPPRPILFKLIKALPLRCLFRLPRPAIFIRMFCIGSDPSGRLITLFRRSLLDVPPAILEQRLKILASADLEAELARIKVPALYIQASEGKLVPKANARPFLSRIGKCTLARLKGPHFILQARPLEAAKKIVEFLGQCQKIESITG